MVGVHEKITLAQEVLDAAQQEPVLEHTAAERDALDAEFRTQAHAHVGDPAGQALVKHRGEECRWDAAPALADKRPDELHGVFTSGASTAERAPAEIASASRRIAASASKVETWATPVRLATASNSRPALVLIGAVAEPATRDTSRHCRESGAPALSPNQSGGVSPSSPAAARYAIAMRQPSRAHASPPGWRTAAI